MSGISESHNVFSVRVMFFMYGVVVLRVFLNLRAGVLDFDIASSYLQVMQVEFVFKIDLRYMQFAHFLVLFELILSYLESTQKISYDTILEIQIRINMKNG